MNQEERIQQINSSLALLSYYAKECKVLRENAEATEEEFGEFLGIKAEGVEKLENFLVQMPPREAVRAIVVKVDLLHEMARALCDYYDKCNNDEDDDAKNILT